MVVLLQKVTCRATVGLSKPLEVCKLLIWLCLFKLVLVLAVSRCKLGRIYDAP